MGRKGVKRGRLSPPTLFLSRVDETRRRGERGDKTFFFLFVLGI